MNENDYPPTALSDAKEASACFLGAMHTGVCNASPRIQSVDGNKTDHWANHCGGGQWAGGSIQHNGVHMGRHRDPWSQAGRAGKENTAGEQRGGGCWVEKAVGEETQKVQDPVCFLSELLHVGGVRRSQRALHVCGQAVKKHKLQQNGGGHGCPECGAGNP